MSRIENYMFIWYVYFRTFVALCETFLSDVINDSEISFTNFNINRCDKHSLIGGGVCIYLKQSICYDLLLSYSNSVCDLLIIQLIQPELRLLSFYIDLHLVVALNLRILF